ncbi:MULTISPECIES: ABC transporter ATP-binding protein [unclassified Corynebacterium]|uniref:ABC transporter ATP-binding protein n=1 Tax=unclassified Corynebacterium TaxID=2624378 RepID=UPI002A91DAF5|nr:ABC transporter ATP-binding protein [Corynebacterium sp.]MDY5784515.1 ABC transporter ATP-binding protein [Corynebacterium sp.]
MSTSRGTLAATTDSTALVADNVVKRFGAKTAVDGVSFTVERGTVLALLGPNGAGKTTTVEMCEGFTAPTSGAIRVLGIDPAHDPDRLRERIGIMLQGGGSYSGIKVGEMLRLSASYNHDPLDPEWLIELLGLGGVRNTTYRRLSGGQKQRLSLALAMISRPELIFLDEPTAGMDAQSRLAVWDIISEMRRDGVTVVLTTHLMDEAEALADKVVIMDQGRVVAQGTPGELTSHQRSPLVSFETVEAFDLSLLDASLAPFHVTVEASRPLHYRIAGVATPEIIATVAAEAARQGIHIRQLGVSHRNLEDVFLDITGRELRS